MQLASSRVSFSENEAKRERKTHLLLFLIIFLVGILTGAFFNGQCSSLLPLADGYIFERFSEFGPVQTLFWCYRFHLIAFFIGTSFLGVFFIPLLVFFRAFLLALASTFIISYYPDNAIIMTIVTVGLPAFISVPCFMLVSSESLSSSLCLLRLQSGNYSHSRLWRCKYFFICLPIMAICIIVETKLVPYLALLLIK